MPQSLQTRHVLPMLRQRGLKVNRESLAELSDLLGLQARPRVGNEVPRAWSPPQVELMALALTLRQRWLLSYEDIRRLVGPDARDYGAEVLDQLATLLSSFGQLAAAERSGATPEALAATQPRTTAA